MWRFVTVLKECLRIRCVWDWGMNEKWDEMHNLNSHSAGQEEVDREQQPLSPENWLCLYTFGFYILHYVRCATWAIKTWCWWVRGWSKMVSQHALPISTFSHQVETSTNGTSLLCPILSIQHTSNNKGIAGCSYLLRGKVLLSLRRRQKILSRTSSVALLRGQR
jgi:hypothetical protein